MYLVKLLELNAAMLCRNESFLLGRNELIDSCHAYVARSIMRTVATKVSERNRPSMRKLCSRIAVQLRSNALTKKKTAEATTSSERAGLRAVRRRDMHLRVYCSLFAAKTAFHVPNPGARSLM